MSETRELHRRRFLGLALAGTLVPVGTAACAAGGSGSEEPDAGPTGEVSDDNPFGVADGAAVEAVIFDGGYGTDYVSAVAATYTDLHGGELTVAPSTQIAQEMQPRFVGGNPPDLLDNSGANAIGLATIAAQLEDLTPLTEAKNTDGDVIADTLYPGMLDDGYYDGRLVQLNYVLTVYGLWYSKTLFDANGWTAPATWDDVLALGAAAKSAGKYLFCWGKEAASYYLTLAVESAIKEGGDEVRIALGNLEADAWSQPAVQAVFAKMAEAVQAGYFRPGGAGTQFTAAQAQWSQAQEAILYPSGSWIENEMKSQTAADFQMTGCPAPSVTAGAAMPPAAFHASAGEPFVVPSQAKNKAGGMEVLRLMLSKEGASNFAETKLSSTIVKDTVPADAFGSTALASQIAMLDAAGENTFTFNFNDVYGFTSQNNVLWNGFMSGQLDVAGLTSGLQQQFDATREDPSIVKVEVS
ncbi:N-acetylglucosamine/diacetylchitobiose ABC transporter substrate-binding protein [Kineococcus sp. SYSU DK003]|uniref:N-acetylglucosamine/diacetylchitobiose ABC transporter substrate-binding protein n=1 Tax=Kineococcus sp. SYSU DK003 TaxID=3383124 RepID=UPI003D7D31BB